MMTAVNGVLGQRAASLVEQADDYETEPAQAHRSKTRELTALQRYNPAGKDLVQSVRNYFIYVFIR